MGLDMKVFKNSIIGNCYLILYVLFNVIVDKDLFILVFFLIFKNFFSGLLFFFFFYSYVLFEISLFCVFIKIYI